MASRLYEILRKDVFSDIETGPRYLHQYQPYSARHYRQTSNKRCMFVGNKIVWSLRCSWSITCQHCFNYIFILHLTPGFKRLGKENCKTRWETSKFWDLMWVKELHHSSVTQRLILGNTFKWEGFYLIFFSLITTCYFQIQQLILLGLALH